MSDNIDRSDWDPKKCWAASKRQSGKQCGNYPIRGAKTCLRHGSGSKKARAAAARNLEQEKLTRVARRLGTPHTDLDPAQALLDLVASKAGEVEWLRHQVELLETDCDLWWGETKVVGKDNPEFGEQYERTAEARQHVVYTLLHKAQDQLARYAAETLKAGVDERRYSPLTVPVQLPVPGRSGLCVPQRSGYPRVSTTATGSRPSHLRAARPRLPTVGATCLR
ncbi:hypothetical protein [Brevibacterium sp. JSBI002]|uniref:hypothetical protein n=1 Tax=Brevibacterium sp. JSBI002 TaxID=2886045 RepID=UPI00222F6DC5|nr:hypothetical protein [Brevibacterium sp. JSBI002]UZD63021.1 hypothetical protein LJ362_04000 [Brevibacterium sp. JSBI002]